MHFLLFLLLSFAVAVASEIGPGFSPDITGHQKKVGALAPETYALTSVTHERKYIFRHATYADLMLATIVRYRDAGRFLLHGYVIMPDHIHVLLTPKESIEKTAQLIKGGFSFAVRKQYPGEVWQAGYHAHRITDDEDYSNQLRYIASNPSRGNLHEYPYVHTTGTVSLDERPGPGG